MLVFSEDSAFKKKLFDCMSRSYETILVYPSSFTEVEIREETAKFETFLKASGGFDVKVDHWGRKDIAYEVSKNKIGIFVCVSYSSNVPETVGLIANNLRISERVIKFQTHRIADKVRKFKGNLKRIEQRKKLALPQTDDFDMLEAEMM